VEDLSWGTLAEAMGVYHSDQQTRFDIWPKDIDDGHLLRDRCSTSPSTTSPERSTESENG
jgi:hypothetical protein